MAEEQRNYYLMRKHYDEYMRELEEWKKEGVTKEEAKQRIDRRVLADTDIDKVYGKDWEQNKVTNVEEIKPLSVTHPFLKKKKKIKNLDKICLWKGDITKLKIDAIVNAGNSDGLGCFVPTHVCIDNQIHSEAGVGLRLECYDYMVKVGGKLNDGEAMITNAYNLPCKKVIQTVGPCLEGGYGPSKKQSSDLGECYTNSLKLLTENNLHSIAFPAISTGLYGFPKDQAAVIAIRKIDEYISEFNGSKDKIKVLLNVYDDSNLNVYEYVLKSYF